MATSGTTTFSCTESDIITAALRKIGVAQEGQSLNADQLTRGRFNLNLIVKQWVAQADFAPGLKMWTRRRAYLFLQDGQVEYSIGPSGDECASDSYLMTSLSNSELTGATSVTLVAAPGVAIGWRVGILLPSGSFQWVAATAVAGTTVTFATGLSESVVAGGLVFAYAAKPNKPFEIVSASLRDTDLNDTPLDPHLSLDEYELIPTKQVVGTPSRLYFEAQKTAGKVFLDCAPEDLTNVIRLVFFSYIEDLTSQTQDVDFPAEWFRALVGQLAMDCATDFSRPIAPELKLYRDEGLTMAKNAHPSNSTAYFLSDPDCY